MQDWSLDPRFRSVLGRLPLPVKLPTPLQRAAGPWHDRALDGRRAVLTRLRDPLDLALGYALQAAGAAVTVADAEPKPDLLAQLVGVARAQVPPDPAGGLLAAIRTAGAHQDRRPVVLVHRVVAPLPGSDPAVNEATDRLFAAGHAAAHQVKGSRLILVHGDDLTRTPEGLLVAAASGGLNRSAHKELGPQGSTSHVVRQAGGAAADVAAVVTFLASPHAAFLTGLDLQVGATAQGDDRLPARALHGKVALVTGAARGIGAAIAERLAAEGAHVWINDLPSAEAAASETLGHIRAAGGQASFVAADIATEAGAQVVRQALQAGERLDVVIHNAGITRDRTLRKLALSQWRLVLQVDLGAMATLQQALDPLMQPGGSLVLLSSVMGLAGNFGQANYTAAKSAVIELARQWAEAGKARDVSAAAIAPGFILTEMTAHLPLLNREMGRQLTALLQPGAPRDVAELAWFLCTPAGRSLSGQVVRCDGGFAMGR